MANPPDEQPSANHVGCALGGLVVFVGAIAVVMPIFAQPRHGSPRAACLSNVRTLGTAAQIYLADYDDRFMIEPWDDVLVPYTKNRQTYECPRRKDVGFFYGLNVRSIGLNAAQIKDVNRFVLFFETDVSSPGVVCNLAGRSSGMRHESEGVGWLTIGRADGSAKLVKPSDVLYDE